MINNAYNKVGIRIL